MVRFAPGFFGFAMLVLYVYSVFDVIASDNVLVRNLPKTTWLFIVLLFPGVGAIAWLALGRPMYAGWRPGDTTTRGAGPGQWKSDYGQKPRPRSPEDAEDWTDRSPDSRAEATGRTANDAVEDAASDIDESDDAGNESDAARERRLMEWEAELKRRETDLDDSDDD